MQQFHADALKGRSNKTLKEIATLQRFLFKNQAYRFSENEKMQLFGAIQSYYAMFAVPASWNSSLSSNPVLPLLEDALKMPFNVVGTKQKKRLLKWYTELSGQDEVQQLNVGGGFDAATKKTSSYQVLDMGDDSGFLSLLEIQSGEMREDLKLNLKTEMAKKMKAAFDEGKEVHVEIVNDTIVNYCIINDD